MPTRTEEHIGLLGMPAKDKITGTKGVITSVCFDLYGCVQVILTLPVDEKGAPREAGWWDIKRMQLTGKTPVLTPPDFNQPEAGGFAKPMPRG